jgi:hypothetical protein
MKIKALRTLFIVSSISLLAACAVYPEPQRRSGPVMGAVVVGGGGNQRAAQSSRISAAEARRLAVANGLTGYKRLPPGIAKNLARGKPLPPGIARTRVPGGMLNSLPRIEGHEWQISGRDLLLVAIGTLIVVEVLQNVFE